jgi:hypothetical protein
LALEGSFDERSRKAKAFGVAFLCAALAAGMPLRTAAQESFPDMPTYNIFSDEELRRDFVRIEYDKPLDRPALGFLLLVPATWDEVPLTVSRDELEHDDRNMISLALLRAPEKGVQVEVAYCRVPETVALETWARAYLEGSGLELFRFQTGTFSGRQVFDTLLSAPGDYKVRMTFSRHGDKVFIVSGSAPASLYERHMKVFGLASVSFRKL